VSCSLDTASIVVKELDYADTDAVSEFYRVILVPHFDPDELETEASIRLGLREGRTKVLTARSADGTLVGGVVVDWFARSEVLLLSYIAVPDRYRGHGIGRRLLTATNTAWASELRPLLIVGEVEDPRYYHDNGYGDPERRVEMYERIGVRSLPIPYMQPSLSEGKARVPHLLLMVFGGSKAPGGTGHVDGRIIEKFLIEYYSLAEGEISYNDADVQRLLSACRQPGGLPLLVAGEVPDTD
jgi:GNAT superfamily N-acetyltransferase